MEAVRHIQRMHEEFGIKAVSAFPAGCFPMGLSLERIFHDMPSVPLRDHVWPKFLRENAIRAFGLKP